MNEPKEKSRDERKLKKKTKRKIELSNVLHSCVCVCVCWVEYSIFDKSLRTFLLQIWIEYVSVKMQLKDTLNELPVTSLLSSWVYSVFKNCLRSLEILFFLVFFFWIFSSRTTLTQRREHQIKFSHKINIRQKWLPTNMYKKR